MGRSHLRPGDAPLQGQVEADQRERRGDRAGAVADVLSAVGVGGQLLTTGEDLDVLELVPLYLSVQLPAGG
jgi:hypothetical protein